MAEALSFNVMDPPKTITKGTDGVEKHVFAEFPKHLHKPGGKHVVVANEAEQAAMLDAGWSLDANVAPAKPTRIRKGETQGDEA